MSLGRALGARAPFRRLSFLPYRVGPLHLGSGIGVEVRELALVALHAMPLLEGAAGDLLGLVLLQLCCCGRSFFTTIGCGECFSFPPAFVLPFASSFAFGLAPVSVTALSPTILLLTLKRVEAEHQGELLTAKMAVAALLLAFIRGQRTGSVGKGTAEFKAFEDFGHRCTPRPGVTTIGPSVLGLALVFPFSPAFTFIFPFGRGGGTATVV